jgi:hypothetical protein
MKIQMMIMSVVIGGLLISGIGVRAEQQKGLSITEISFAGSVGKGDSTPNSEGAVNKVDKWVEVTNFGEDVNLSGAKLIFGNGESVAYNIFSFPGNTLKHGQSVLVGDNRTNLNSTVSAEYKHIGVKNVSRNSDGRFIKVALEQNGTRLDSVNFGESAIAGFENSFLSSHGEFQKKDLQSTVSFTINKQNGNWLPSNNTYFPQNYGNPGSVIGGVPKLIKPEPKVEVREPAQPSAAVTPQNQSSTQDSPATAKNVFKPVVEPAKAFSFQEGNPSVAMSSPHVALQYSAVQSISANNFGFAVPLSSKTQVQPTVFNQYIPTIKIGDVFLPKPVADTMLAPVIINKNLAYTSKPSYKTTFDLLAYVVFLSSAFALDRLKFLDKSIAFKSHKEVYA